MLDPGDDDEKADEEDRDPITRNIS